MSYMKAQGLIKWIGFLQKAMLVHRFKYRRYKLLNPEGRRLIANICGSCGITEGEMLFHPDPNVDMTICNREYRYYIRGTSFADM